MKINNIFASLLTVAAVATLSSCDSFLDIQPVGKVIPTTVPEFRSLITEAYVTVPDDRGLASFRSDEILLDATMSSNDLGSYLDIWRWNDDAADENTASFSWRQFYHVLFIANYVIESEHLMTDGTTDEIKQIVGEAYMLRAYMHFLLVNLHAPAYTACDPATTKAIPVKLDSDVEGVLTRDYVEDVYAAIQNDLDAAERNLNVDAWEHGLNYRFTTLSVDALRSRVMLYMGNWDEARKAADRVLAKRNTLSDLDAELPSQYNSAENILALEQVMTAQYARAFKVNRDFYRLYSSSDLRRRAYFNQVTSSNILLKKGGSNTYTCSFRVAEMLLNAAEATCRLGNTDDAAEYLLTLQRTRYNDGGAAKETAVAAMDKEQLLAEILEERARELAFEGHRWFDLRRTDRPRIERSYRGETFVLEQNDPRYTIRIPNEAIEANPGLAD
ncbi:MAG: RagB/SusD family nutrient uptake outer membrane protein [Muribaculaceae bacterium]|nr:RagB/SusD family nutrient uptake outer membrane protein [Muribaculaceae bacterium]